MSTSDRSGGAATAPRGSKMKIMQLREQLNNKGMVAEAQPEKVKILRDSYEIARNRSNELHNPNYGSENVYMKVHEQRAGKVYSALSSLIFASICAAKVDELEEFVKKTAASIPSSIFDLDEWSRIISLAKECRTVGPMAMRQEADALRRNLRLTYSIATHPLDNMRSEIRMLRSDVSNQLRAVQHDLLSAMNAVVYLTNELKDRTNSDRNVQRIERMISDCKEMKDSLETAKREHTEQMAAAAATHESELAAAKEAHAALTEELAQTKATLDTERVVHTEDMTTNNKLKEDLTASQQQNATLVAELESVNKLLAKDAAELEEHRAALYKERVSSVAEKAAAASIDNAQFQVAMSMRQREAADLSRQLSEKMETEVLSLQQTVNQLQQQLTEATAKAEQAESNQQLHMKADEAMQQEFEAIKRKLTDAEQLNAEKDASIVKLQEQLTDLTAASTESSKIGVIRENALKQKVVDLEEQLATMPAVSVAPAGLSAFLDALSAALTEHKGHALELKTASSTSDSEIVAPVAVAKDRPLSPAGEHVDSLILQGTSVALRRLSPSPAEQRERIAVSKPLTLAQRLCDEIDSLLQHVAQFQVDSATASDSSAATDESITARHQELMRELRGTHAKEVEELKDALVAEQKKMHEIEAVLKRKEEEMEELRKTIDVTAAAAACTAAAATADTEEKLSSAIKQLASLENDLKDGQDQLQSKDLTIAELKATVERLETHVADKENNIESLKAQLAEDNAAAQPSAEERQQPTPGAISDLSEYEQSEGSVVALQSQMRSFLARAKVRKIKEAKAAEARGVLVACHGTEQGKTGWYKTNGELYFFCMDNGEYILLCGPINDDIYNLACEEIGMISQPNASESGTSNNRRLELDRLGLQATRIQIETLFDDIRSRDDIIAKQKEEIEEQKADLTSKKDKVLELQQTILQIENDRIKTKMETIASSIEQNGQQITPEMEQAFNKLSSAMRGYLGRNRVKKIKNFKLAKETGQLIPLKNTNQGDTGWYAAPDGGIYYFILKEDRWIHTVGPLTEEEYDANRVAMKAKQRSHAEGVLTQCKFDVIAEHEEILGDHPNLFLANGTEKLYFALPVQDVLKPVDGDCEMDGAPKGEKEAPSPEEKNQTTAPVLDSEVSVDGSLKAKSTTSSTKRKGRAPLMSQTSQASLSSSGTEPALKSPQASPAKRPKEPVTGEDSSIPTNPLEKIATNSRLIQQGANDATDAGASDQSSAVVDGKDALDT